MVALSLGLCVIPSFVGAKVATLAVSVPQFTVQGDGVANFKLDLVVTLSHFREPFLQSVGQTDPSFDRQFMLGEVRLGEIRFGRIG